MDASTPGSIEHPPFVDVWEQYADTLSKMGSALWGGGCWVPSPLGVVCVDAGYPSRVNSYLGLALGTHELITDTELHNTPKTSLSVAVLHCRICYLYLSCYRAASVHFRAHMHNMCANPSLLINLPHSLLLFNTECRTTDIIYSMCSLPFHHG